MAGAPAACRCRPLTLTPDDTLKVIDQGADDTTNAVSIRKFFERTAGVETTTATATTVIQTRHRIPEEPLTEGQILVYQVPIPEPLRFLEPRESETRKMHALEEYGLMHVKLYEDIRPPRAYRDGLRLSGEGRGPLCDGPVADPEISTTPSWATWPRSSCSARGASSGSTWSRPTRKWSASISRITPSKPSKADHPCALCGAEDSYLDEVIIDDAGGRMFVCSDTDYCEARQAAGHVGKDAA
jgi:alpha-D-ribose 1-methylphosphonate 5-phosphate C-P lyase